MPQKQHFIFLVNLLVSFLKLSTAVLLLMSLSRLYLFLNYGGASTYTIQELFNVFFLGLRLDIIVVVYIFALPILTVFIVWLLNIRATQRYLYPFFRAYFILFILILISLVFADLVYFSYFGEHSTLMIFGVIDDDTKALIQTALKNYNIPLIALLGSLFYAGVTYMIIKLLKDESRLELEWSKPKQSIFFLTLILLTLFLGRGTLGTYQLARYIPDISTDVLINNLPTSPAYAVINSYKEYKKSKSGNTNITRKVGYEGKINQAFMLHTGKKNIDTNDLIKNITYTTAKNEKLKKRPPHVVVVMVESFGMPLLDYQSESFNIMGSLKKHFQEDLLFSNFISSHNGTIVSLEPVLLNITALPSATAFSQSMSLNTHFKQASAKVYEDAGYETSYIYGGDISWRNTGSFMSRQGFQNIEGRGKIASYFNKDVTSISHDWGIFDEHLYNYVYEKLLHADTPQFIFILTTNNHPPHIIPSDYKSNKLEMSDKLKKHITGDLDLTKVRLKDYAYAVDSAGHFLDKIKASPLAEKSVVAITADNNTIEGIMHYDDHYKDSKRIPFYIYLPKELRPITPIDMRVASSHKDIFPTLYNLTLSEQTYTAIGTDLLDESIKHCGFNVAGIIVTKESGFKFKKAVTPEEKYCQEYYKATLAVTDYLIKSNKN